jgi:hypothetical protein
MTEKWICIACKFILGFVEDKHVVRIKRKDLYVEIEGGRITEICPRCGKPNTIVDENTKSKGGE